MDKESTRVILGSGHLYLAELEDGAVPEQETLFSEKNKVGCIQGGAELSYTPTLYEVKCDDDITHETYITDEEVILKTGILTWILSNISKISVGCRYENNTLYIGGEKSVKHYAVGFRHEAKDGYYVDITMIGRGNKGFTITFAKDKETVIDAELKALKDKDGVLVKITEYLAREN